MDDALAVSLAELDTLLTLVQLKSRAIRRQDLNLPRSQILLRLYYAAEHRVPQVELADSLQLAVSQVQKLTEELQSQGFVARSPGAPRGGFFVSLTQAGVRESEVIIQHRAKNEFKLLDQLLNQHTKDPKAVGIIVRQLKRELADKAA